MIQASLILLGTILVVILLILNKFKNSKSLLVLPPGPTGFPFFGYWPTYLGDHPYHQFDAWAKKYGEIFRVRIGGKLYVVLNSFDALRQVYVQDLNGNNSLNRAQNYTVLESAFEFRSVGSTNGPEWALQRKLFGTLMRRSDPRPEAATRQSCEDLLRRIQSICAEGPIDVYDILAEGVLNAISHLIIGQNLMDTDPTHAKEIISDARQIYNNSPCGDGFMFGWMIKLLVNRFTKKYEILEQIKSRQFLRTQKFLREHELTFDPTNLRDYIDVCLNERLKSKSAEERDWLCDANLIANISLFFVAGIDTTATTLYMAMFLLAKNQLVQEKCYDELISVVGKDFNGLIKSSDKSKFPYLTAVIDEINRYAIIVAMQLPRETIQETTFRGYDIPARSQVVTNLYSATRDTKYFQNPYEFDPNNFYQKDLPREINTLSFSVGRRNCPGQNLATLELFIFLTHLLLSFKFSPEPGVELKENINPGFVRCLYPFKLVCTKRNK